MAAIQVYKTDTFETQRLKINQIGQLVSNFSGGGNDFAAGNLKLGDGSLSAPSLSFTSDNTLGFYKPLPKTLGIASSNRKVFEISDVSVTAFQDFVVQSQSLSNAQLRVDSYGTEYDVGAFSNVPLDGGTGLNGTANFVVTAYVGSVTTIGEGYVPGEYFNVPLTSGSGSNAVVNVTVDDLEGDITEPGSGYTDGAYEGISLTNISSSGSNATADVLVNGGEVTLVIVRSVGSGYQFGDVLSANTADIGGTGSGFEYTISTYPQQLRSFTFVERGSGYAAGDVLGVDATYVGNSTPTTPFEFTITNVGEITSFNIQGGGAGYFQDDVLTIDPTYLTAPIGHSVAIPSLQEITFVENVGSTYYSVGDTVILDGGDGTLATVYQVNTSGSSLVSIVIDALDLEGGEIIRFDEGDEIERTVDTVQSYSRIVVDGLILRNLTFIPGETYVFNLEDPTNADHTFALSKFPGGIWGRGYVQNVSSTLSTTSTTVSIADTSVIFEDMIVSVASGTGSLVTDTRVVSIDSATDITISKLPLISGPVSLNFRGSEYTTNVIREPDFLTIKVTEDTPDLYYFDNTDNVEHANEGGLPNQEATVDVDQANPRTNFGSGFQVTVAEVAGTDSLRSSPSTGLLKTTSFETASATITQQVSNNITSSFLTSTSAEFTTVSSIDEDITFSATNFVVNSDFLVSNKLTVARASGELITAGRIKSQTGFNSNDFLTIDNNIISGTSGNDIILTPAAQRVAKVNSSTALIVPVGDNNQRPQAGVVETGAIRFNTTTQQYEGYNATAVSWSSLGGVRDVDGNTYILAEASVGANDNTLYFYNNANNTLRLTTSYLDFRSTKKIRSENMSAPAYTVWTPNTPVQSGDYLKYKNNVYQVASVSGAGLTAGSANPPIHDTGTEINGDVTLLWDSSAVDAIIFEEITSVQIDPNGTSPLEVNDELVFEQSVIRTKIEDLTINPAPGKKVRVFASSSLVVPVGSTLDRGTAEQGSIRYNTTISQYEGYNGSNWSSLGGVRDVDGNTYIIPELTAGSNENILYFYNDDNNTLQLSVSGLDFVSTDNITSSQSDTLNINVSNVTFDNLGFAIDNSGTSTLLTSTKESVDFKLSTGLSTEKLFSLTDEGELVVNSGYTTGSVSDIVILDYNLKDFELADRKDSTEVLNLQKGTIDTNSSIIYDTSIHASGKVSVIVDNVTKNERELIDFNICHKGSDIFYNEYGNITTSSKLITVTFDITISNEIRMNCTLNANNDSADVVNIVVLKTAIKK